VQSRVRAWIVLLELLVRNRALPTPQSARTRKWRSLTHAESEILTMADAATLFPTHLGYGEAVRRGNSLPASLGGRAVSDAAEKSRFGPIPRGTEFSINFGRPFDFPRPKALGYDVYKSHRGWGGGWDTYAQSGEAEMATGEAEIS